MLGLRGELSSKELYVIMAVAKNNSIARMGRFSLLFGQVVNLKVPLKAGTIRITWPSSVPSWRRPAKLKKVDIFDIEPALCGAFIYAKQAA